MQNNYNKKIIINIKQNLKFQLYFSYILINIKLIHMNKLYNVTLQLIHI